MTRNDWFLDSDQVTVTFVCKNRDCGFNVDEHGEYVGPSEYEVPALAETEGGAEPYLQHTVYFPDEDKMECPECGTEGEEK